MRVYNNNNSSTGRMSFSKGNRIKINVGNKWYKADYLGYEGASEYVSYELSKQTNICEYMELTECRLEEISVNDKIFNGCVSDNFLRENETLITADGLFKKNIGMSVSEFLNEQPRDIETQIKTFVDKVVEITDIEDFGKKLTALLEWDSLILNKDRHFSNIAFVYDETDSSYKISPLFDNGASFLSDMREDYPKFNERVLICRKLYGCQLVLDSDIAILKETLDEVGKMYGNIVSERIRDIFERQRSVTDIPFEKNLHCAENSENDSFDGR